MEEFAWTVRRCRLDRYDGMQSSDDSMTAGHPEMADDVTLRRTKCMGLLPSNFRDLDAFTQRLSNDNEVRAGNGRAILG